MESIFFFFLLGHHHLDEFFVVDLTITIDIGFTNHFVDFLVGELLSEIGHDVTEFSSADVAVAVLVEDLEGFLDLLLGIGILHLAGHHGQELGEINGSVAVSIDLVDHVLEFGLGGVLSEGKKEKNRLCS